MWKILIVEDEIKVRRGLVNRLKRMDLPVLDIYIAKNGKDAIEIIEKEGLMDLYLLDIHMDEISGLQFGTIIKKRDPKALIIFITGYDYFEYAHEAIKLQALDYLLKPIPYSDFQRVIIKAIEILKERDPKTGEKLEKHMENNKVVAEENCSRLVEESKKIIEDNYSNPSLSLNKVAQTLHINKDYLSKLMKEELGFSFKEYLTKTRIQRAKELLENEGINIKIYDISQKVGYQSQHYFSRVFRKHVGLSPMQFRNKKQK